MTKELRRSKSNKIVAGVCGGLGMFFNIDPVIIRIIWFILLFTSRFPAIIAYLICIILIPEEDDLSTDENFQVYEDEDIKDKKTKNTSIYFGLGLILIGIYMLLVRISPKFTYYFYKVGEYWPILLVILGFYIIIKRKKDND